MKISGFTFDRRRFLKAGAAGLGLTGVPALVRAQGAKVKIGLMLPFSGAYALLGVSIENGFRLALKEAGVNRLGREVQFVKVDDESDPAKAADNIDRLVNRDKVDLVVGTVNAGVAAEMMRVTRAANVLHIIPNAGLASAGGALCAPNIFRTSFSNWQAGFAMGTVIAKRTAVRRVITLGWRTVAGEESIKGFRDAYLNGGGKVTRELWLPFPAADFHALLSEIAARKPHAVYAFLAGNAAATFIRNYNQSGLMSSVPLIGPGFLTEGILGALGDAAEGVETTLHYGDGLDTPRNIVFRRAYTQAHGRPPDVYAVAGYDAGQLFTAGMQAVAGDVSRKIPMIKAMEQARIDSPRGLLRISKNHNPIHNQYLRKVVGNENRVMDIAVKALDDDPATQAACRMATPEAGKPNRA